MHKKIGQTIVHTHPRLFKAITYIKLKRTDSGEINWGQWHYEKKKYQIQKRTLQPSAPFYITHAPFAIRGPLFFYFSDVMSFFVLSFIHSDKSVEMWWVYIRCSDKSRRVFSRWFLLPPYMQREKNFSPVPSAESLLLILKHGKALGK